MRTSVWQHVWIAVVCAATVPVCRAQSCPPASTIPELVKALDDAVSGPGNKDRACLRALMMPDAKLIPLAKSDDGKWTPRVLTVDDWITRVAKRGTAEFYERQVKYSVQSYSQIAQLWSTFEIRPTPNGKATARGINAIQAIRVETVGDGSGWKVSQIVWKDESPGDPVPAKDLP
jgi:hypothetical protein